MTRTAAREIAIQICYASLLSGTPVDEVTDALFAPEYFATLSEENEIFRTKPNEKQLSYIRALTGQTDAHLEDLNAIIEKYSRDWKVERISKVAATILRCAIAEILYLDEVPSRSMKRWNLQKGMKSRKRFLSSTASSAASFAQKWNLTLRNRKKNEYSAHYRFRTECTHQGTPRQ